MRLFLEQIKNRCGVPALPLVAARRLSTFRFDSLSDLIPLVLAVFLAVAPATVYANSNQVAAEKIAASLGDRFPGYDIAVSYQNGKVRLVGQVVSLDMMHSTLEHVQRVPGVPVTEVDNGLSVMPGGPIAVPAAPAPVSRDVISRPAAPPTPAVAAIAPPVAGEPVQAPKPAKVKRSVWSPQPKPQVANAPVPIPKPEKAVVVQVSNREQMAKAMQPPAPIAGAPHGAPLEYAYPPQHMHGQYQGQYPGQYQQYQGAPQGQYQGQYQGPPMGAAYHPEAYGPQGPMPGQYNHPNLPDYAWPSYACYPNYAEVCYPKQYSPKAWPYIGPFYPYPQAPLGWRKVTLEHHDGWWWLDFDDGAPSGPFSPLFRQPIRYTY